MVAPGAANKQLSKAKSQTKGAASKGSLECRSLLQKTVLCKFFAIGKCTKGRFCTFSHDEAELHSQPELSRTTLCPSLMGGGRCRNPRCTFAHARGELRKAQPRLVPPPGLSLPSSGELTTFLESKTAESCWDELTRFQESRAAESSWDKPTWLLELKASEGPVEPFASPYDSRPTALRSAADEWLGSLRSGSVKAMASELGKLELRSAELHELAGCLVRRAARGPHRLEPQADLVALRLQAALPPLRSRCAPLAQGRPWLKDFRHALLHELELDFRSRLSAARRPRSPGCGARGCATCAGPDPCSEDRSCERLGDARQLANLVQFTSC